MAVTTSDSLKHNKGDYCSICKTRKALVAWRDSVGGYVCQDCDPKEPLVREVSEDTPVTRGRGA